MEIIALVAMYSLTNFSITCSIPRRTFPPLRRLARSELYPVAWTISEGPWIIPAAELAKPRPRGPNGALAALYHMPYLRWASLYRLSDGGLPPVLYPRQFDRHGVKLLFGQNTYNSTRNCE